MTGDTAQQQEPSMEEILASIRKIISEDGPQESENKDVVALTDPAPEIESPPQIEQTDTMPETQTAKPDFSMTEVEAQLGAVEQEMPEIQPSPPPPPQPVKDHTPTPQDALLDERAVSQAASAFGRLQQSDEPLADQLEQNLAPPLPNIGQMTVEDLVKQTLKPILKEWLDVNLAPMVEDHIRREMERIRNS